MATDADAEENRALVTRIAGGDGRAREAEATLCRRFATRIRLYGMRHLRDSDLTRDLVQMVLMAVLEAARAGRVREPEHLERFILATCRNTVIRLRQKQARTQSVDSEDMETLLVSDDEGGAPIDNRALLRCLETLEARARRVVTMAFKEDRSADEIATVLATTAGNIRVIRHRALTALRLCLDGPK